MAVIWKFWRRIKNWTLSIDAYLREEQSRQISSRSDLKRRNLRLFWRSRPNNNNNNMISAISRLPHNQCCYYYLVEISFCTHYFALSNFCPLKSIVLSFWNSTLESIFSLPVSILGLYVSTTGWHSIYLPRRDRRLTWARWLVTHTKMVYPPTDGHPSNRSKHSCSVRAKRTFSALYYVNT